MRVALSEKTRAQGGLGDSKQHAILALFRHLSAYLTSPSGGVLAASKATPVYMFVTKINIRCYNTPTYLTIVSASSPSVPRAQ